MRRVLAIIVLALALASTAGEAAPLASVPDGGRLAFAVMRQGSRIGGHWVEFHRDGETLIVESRIEVKVSALFIVLYRFTARRTETWRDGRLVAYVSDTDDDGKRSMVRARADAQGIAVEATDGKWTLPGTAVPDSFWNRALVEGAPIFDVENGRPLTVKIEALGSSPPPGGTAPADRFRLTGDDNFELWYRPDGVWAGMRTVGSDGSIVDYVAE